MRVNIHRAGASLIMPACLPSYGLTVRLVRNAPMSNLAFKSTAIEPRTQVIRTDADSKGYEKSLPRPC